MFGVGGGGGRWGKGGFVGVWMVNGTGTRGTGGVGSDAVAGEENGHKKEDEYNSVTKEGGKEWLYVGSLVFFSFVSCVLCAVE